MESPGTQPPLLTSSCANCALLVNVADQCSPQRAENMSMSMTRDCCAGEWVAAAQEAEQGKVEGTGGSAEQAQKVWQDAAHVSHDGGGRQGVP